MLLWGSICVDRFVVDLAPDQYSKEMTDLLLFTFLEILHKLFCFKYLFSNILHFQMFWQSKM